MYQECQRGYTRE